MALVNINGQQETFTKEAINLIKDMDMVKCYGMMVVNILEIGLKEFNMDLVKCSSLMVR